MAEVDIQQYGFFDSEITGYDSEGFPQLDRAMDSDFFALFFAKLITNGVLALPASCLQVTASSGMIVSVAAGCCFINGRFGNATEAQTLEVTAADTSRPRITSVMVRLNYVDRKIQIITKDGTPSATPEPPELLQPVSGDYYEIELAQIYVNANQTVITQSAITDMRYDATRCGIVTQLIDHVDTSVLYAQFLTFYEEFKGTCNTSYTEFVENMSAYLTALQNSGDEQLQAIVDSLNTYETTAKSEFDNWFYHIREQLTTDVAGKLQTEIDRAEIERCLMIGLLDGEKTFSEDGSTVTAVDTKNRTLTKTFSEDGSTIETVLVNENGTTLGTMLKTYSEDGSTVTTEVTIPE